MLTRKKIFYVVIIITGITILGSIFKPAFATTTNSETDYAIVYNNQGNKLKVIKSKKDIKYLSNIVGDLSGDLDSHKENEHNAEQQYHYVIYSHSNNEVHKINLYTYSNKKIVKITHLPILSDGIWKITKHQQQTLSNIDNFK